MTKDLEQRILERGLKLYELTQGELPSLFNKEYWMAKALEWCIRHPEFKVELFRFIDVLPYLTSSDVITRHFDEYFCGEGRLFPSGLQIGVEAVCHTPLLSRWAAKEVTGNVRTIGRQFIVGETIDEALPLIQDIRANGLALSLDLLGEAVVSEDEGDRFLRHYLQLLDLLGNAQNTWIPIGNGEKNLDWGRWPKIDVSIKPSAMYSQMSPCAFDHSVARAKDRLRLILRKAVGLGAHVCLDMEHYDLKNLTLALYQGLLEEPEFNGYPYTGTAIQAYLRDSERDLHAIVDWAKARNHRLKIRLVKGAYWDAETVWAEQRIWPSPVFRSKHETDASFERLARYLLQNNEWVDLACASHNLRSIACVIESAKDLDVPLDRVEFQVLYGMAEPVRNALRRAGLAVRLYTPIGQMIPGMAYLVRRLLENTSNESFLWQSFGKGEPPERMLQKPTEKTPQAVNPKESKGPSSKDADMPFQNEPTWDWSLPEHRTLFRKALDRIRKKMPYRIPLRIDGKGVKTKETFVSVNPNAPSERIAVSASAEEAHVAKALDAAKHAFLQWKDVGPRDRAGYLRKAAAVARKMRYDLAALQVYEVGKAWSEADADVCEAIDFLEYYSREMERFSRPRPLMPIAGETSHLHYEPCGVCVVIAPWNFPLAISTGMTSAALVTGNTVVYKPSSNSVVTGSMLYTLFEEAGIPKGVLNFLPGAGGRTGQLLVSHPDVAIIAFTGSRDVGLGIIEAAAKIREGSDRVKRVVAEMGGKNAVILDADADLDEAIVDVIRSAFGYQGQKCSACSRLIVLEDNYEKVLDRLKAAVLSIEVGNPEDPKNFMGALIDRVAMEKVLHYIEIGKHEGRLFISRTEPSAEGFFVPPTVFVEVRADHRIAQEEIFGPVLSVIKVKDFDEALRVANSTPYALTGGLFSRSPANIARASREFRVGNLYINRGCTGAIVGRHPFGGFKMSGVGSKTGGPDYLLQFMVPRNVVENTMRRGFAPGVEQR
jgi:RHH-type proline utilization regulon transcriptional repressor/proline dehydrogenase/delta 1-pyrroline-5-carboxylate dehydrogenase